MTTEKKAVEIPPPPLLSLEDLEPHIVEVSFELVPGVAESRRTAKLAVLSYSEFVEISEEYDEPEVPFVPQSVDGKKKYVRDPNDAEYQQKYANYNAKVAMHRMARSLYRGGMFPQWEGLSEQEMAAQLGKLTYGAARGLNIAMNRFHNFSHAEVVAKSKNFLGVPDSQAGDSEATGLDNGHVEEPALFGTG